MTTDAWPQTAREFLERLVAFDTVSARPNRPLIDFVAAYLKDHGVEPEIIPDAEGTKANLFATIGPADLGGVVLSGHSDVVPVAGQDWHTDPFTVVAREGRLYGRGTADMKSFLAAVLALVPRFVAADLKTPVHLAVSHDEEIGCVGVRSLIDRLAARDPKPALCIIGEPTEMRAVVSHKGIRTFLTEVKGLEGHSSKPEEGINAIVTASRVIGRLMEIAAEKRAAGDPSGRFSPAYTTVSVGTIEGGNAVNIIPRTCRFAWEYRCLPTDDPDEIIDAVTAFAERELLPEMKARHPAAAIVTTERAHAPALQHAPGSPAETLALALLKSNETAAVSYTTEGGLFQSIGIPTVVCGPGSIQEAHKPDEFIEEDQIARCTAFLERLLERLAAGL